VNLKHDFKSTANRHRKIVAGMTQTPSEMLFFESSPAI